ncbi:MAG: hypothetical protein RLY86_3514 [Pseudomonadota bacterium]|jgi:NAD(P)-dependent dehydrogenase (short-subunit alcohol dehydrogenase family)
MPTIVITGANRGIGLELARQYAADGWRVIATARDTAKAGDLSAIAGVEVHALDVTDPAGIQAFADGLGPVTVDVLINNAGIMGAAFPQQSKDGVDGEGWMRTMTTNTLAPVLLTLALREALARAPRPVVANMSSQLGSVAQNESGGMYAYRVSKAGLNMANKSLAVDLREHNICCIVLHPGWVKTDMGGPQAPVEIPDSAAGLRQVIAGATLEQTGRFFAYDGRELPW